MKWNWGTGIAATYSVFVIFMLFMVFRSTQHDHNLVTENYYQKDLQYQDHKDKVNNSLALEQDLKVEYKANSNEIFFQFPTSFTQVSGQVLLFRPSDQGQDRLIEIATEPGKTFRITTVGMARGFWKVKVDWEGDGRSFYKEEEIIL